MRQSRYAVGSELDAWMADELGQSKGRLTVVHAGHFALYTTNSEHVEAVIETPTPPAIELADFGAFCRFTWHFACQHLWAQKDVGARLLVLVNDWQFVGTRKTERGEVASRLDRARREYFRRTARLPRFHCETLKAHDLEATAIFKASDTQWMFSEAELRVSLSRSISELFDRGVAEERGLTKNFTPSGDPIVTFSSDLQGDMCLLYCGSTNCSGEIVELLRVLSERGVQRFFNVYPRQCLGPVLTGTAIASQVYRITGMEVINVAVPMLRNPEQVAVVDRQVF